PDSERRPIMRHGWRCSFASTGGETTVQVGPDVWQVTVNTQEVKAHAQKGRSTYKFTP
ncbi:hypothetical protein Lpp78_10418, partial [Lacticaseibacillus paracasei subsp. paracasei CNCM I-2877]